MDSVRLHTVFVLFDFSIAVHLSVVNIFVRFYFIFVRFLFILMFVFLHFEQSSPTYDGFGSPTPSFFAGFSCCTKQKSRPRAAFLHLLRLLRYKALACVQVFLLQAPGRLNARHR